MTQNTVLYKSLPSHIQDSLNKRVPGLTVYCTSRNLKVLVDGDRYFLIMYKAVRKTEDPKGFLGWGNFYQPLITLPTNRKPYQVGDYTRANKLERSRNDDCEGGLHITTLIEAVRWVENRGFSQGWNGYADRVIEVHVQISRNNLVIPRDNEELNEQHRNFHCDHSKIRCLKLYVNKKVPKKEWPWVKNVRN